MPGALAGAVQLREKNELEQSEWERKLFDELRGLHAEDRERVLNAVKAFVVGLPKRLELSCPTPQKNKINPHSDSRVNSAVQRAKDRAIAAAVHKIRTVGRNPALPERE